MKVVKQVSHVTSVTPEIIMVLQCRKCAGGQYCGVCHSDIHTIHGDWGKIHYPQIVGHELAGEVVAIGTRGLGLRLSLSSKHPTSGDS
jgi:hypothetical protein